MPPEDDPADDIGYEEWCHGLVDADAAPTGRCGWCDKPMHPDEINENETICDDCLAKEETD